MSEPSPTTHHRLKLSVAAGVTLLVVAFGAVVGLYVSRREPLSALLPSFSQIKTPHYLFSVNGPKRPLGIAVNSSGDRLYVTQSDGDRTVLAFDRLGNQVAVLKPPAKTGDMHVPVYVAVNPVTQDVYVSDRMAASIYIYSSSGTYRQTFAPQGNLGVDWSPMGLAFDSHGNLYVTNVAGTAPDQSGPHQRVFEFAPDGKLTRTLGEGSKLNFPNGIAVDSSGNVYVSDSNNSRLLVFTPNGSIAGSISGGQGDSNLALPRGVALDNSGRLYVVDITANMVKMYHSLNGSLVLAYTGSFGSQGSDDGAFEFPNGIAVDTHARIYVADRDNNRVQVWSY